MMQAAKHRLLHNTVTCRQLVSVVAGREPCPGWAPELQDQMRSEAGPVVVEYRRQRYAASSLDTTGSKSRSIEELRSGVAACPETSRTPETSPSLLGSFENEFSASENDGQPPE